MGVAIFFDLLHGSWCYLLDEIGIAAVGLEKSCFDVHGVALLFYCLSDFLPLQDRHPQTSLLRHLHSCSIHHRY